MKEFAQQFLDAVGVTLAAAIASLFGAFAGFGAKAFDDFKKANDELMKAKADGKAVGDLEAKVAKLSAELDKYDELKTVIEDIQKKLQWDSDDLQQELQAEEGKLVNEIGLAHAPNAVSTVPRRSSITVPAQSLPWVRSRRWSAARARATSRRMVIASRRGRVPRSAPPPGPPPATSGATASNSSRAGEDRFARQGFRGGEAGTKSRCGGSFSVYRRRWIS